MPRVLVVDDDAAIRGTWEDLLWSQGYEVETAAEGRAALVRLEAETFDFLILDVLIPHLNGFAVLERLRANALLRELPVLVVSGLYRSDHHRADAVSRYGIVDYLDKPVSPTRLLEIVERTVGPGKPSPKPTRRPSKVGIEPVELSATQAERLVDDGARAEQASVEQEATRDFEPSPFGLQGSIGHTPVAAVLGRLWRERANGALLLRRDKAKKIIYVKDGSAYQVRSNLVSECLGQLLVRERVITAAQCEASVAAMSQRGKRQGEALVELGALTRRNLAFALGLQLETKLFDAFAWTEGAYRFNPQAALPEAEQVLEWQGAALIAEGIRRAMDETRLRALVQPMLDLPLAWAPLEAPHASLGLGAEELHAVETVGMPASTRKLVTEMPLAPTVSLRVVYTLIALGALEPAPN